MGQEEEMERVSAKIARTILQFANSRLDAGSTTFHMDHLVAYVKMRVTGVAPDSASRILRDLRQKKRLDYKILSRRNSHYQLKSVGERMAPT